MDEPLLILDDSGTKEYAPDGVYGDGNTRYFAFGGLLISLAEAKRLVSAICSAKQAAFGTEKVEIKSNWLRMPLERERHYLRKYGISEAQLTAFVNVYYRLLLEADLLLLACVVDKVHMKDAYPNSPWYPPAAAYEPILQRVQNDCDSGLVRGAWRVVIDDMTGATPKHNQYRDNLRRHHAQLKKTGSTLQKGMTFPTLDSLTFVNSRRSHLVQAADVVAYNVYRQFREHGEEWETAGLGTLPTYDWFRRIAGKFRNDRGRIQGYGVVKMPLVRRVPWRVGAART